MAYDAVIADRIRDALHGKGEVVEKRMFGGLCFMLDGHMCCGAMDRRLMLRVGKERYAEALAEPHAETMAFTGRTMEGFVLVSPEGMPDRAELERRLTPAIENVRSLPKRV
jgi:TfoX/Sxy family transcriptional regulator of competence genes